MSEPLNALYQKIVLDHNKSPRNFRQLANANRTGEGSNPSCGDRFTIFLIVDGDTIREIAFQGSGCAIAKASASIMTELAKGKTAAEVQAIFGDYRKMLQGDPVENEIAELRPFAAVRNFPMRIKCALLPWQGLLAALNHPS